MGSGKPTAVQRYAIRFDTDAPADMEPTDGNLREVLAGCALPVPHKLLEPVRRAVRTLRLERSEAARLDEDMRAEALGQQPQEGDPYTAGERVKVEYPTAPPGALGAIVGRSRQVYARITGPQWWTVELDEPTDSGRKIISVPEHALTDLD